ncbi:MAG: hypothetical protein E6K06_01235 [Methanobacteriota archaeon]|nr:MAG: hypothetical protein E6K06_01235 [Euryarchaeota archaeon]
MGSVAVTFRVMPDDPETDLERLKSRIRERLTGSLRDLREQPVAFGLTAILAVALVSFAERCRGRDRRTPDRRRRGRHGGRRRRVPGSGPLGPAPERPLDDRGQSPSRSHDRPFDRHPSGSVFAAARHPPPCGRDGDRLDARCLLRSARRAAHPVEMA